MSEAQQTRRISKVASELNVGVQTVIDFLTDKRFEDVNRNSKISDDMYAILLKEYGAEKSVKEESKKIIQTRLKRESIGIEETQAVSKLDDQEDEQFFSCTIKISNMIFIFFFCHYKFT